MALFVRAKKRWFKGTARFIVMRIFAPRRRHGTYSRLYAYRYLIFALSAMLAASTIIPSVMTATRDNSNDSNRPPSIGAPTRDEVEAAIALGERYINALYKQLPNNQAAQSEASGLPLRAKFGQDDWVLLGEEVEECLDSCRFTTSIQDSKETQSEESLAVSFSSQFVRNALIADVVVNWSALPGQIEISLKPLQVIVPLELWLDQLKLATWKPGTAARTTVKIAANETWRFRMLRYTVRHATQEAYMYWTKRGDKQKAAALATFLSENNFKPGLDMRAPLFGYKDLPDDLPFNESAYDDCDHTPASNEFSYAYRSKVCLFRQTYLEVGARDPFLQAWQALHMLVKYEDPKRQHPKAAWWLQGANPQKIALHLQGQWNRSGFGIPKCTPFICNEMSGIRTSVFGALETLLGYKHGIESAKAFADAAAKMTVTAQVKSDGLVKMKDQSFYRPAQVGAFLSGWDTAEGRFVEPSSPTLVAWLAFKVSGEKPLPSEFEGIIPSNSETTLDALGFLQLYRCHKFLVGC